MAKLNPSIKLGKKGINYVTTVIDDCGCTFLPVDQENDVGIDGHIELFNELGAPTSKLIAVQIKTGNSYYDLDKKQCYIPIDSHREYWANHSIPVMGIVCVMDELNESVDTAYWIDIKEELEKYEDATRISFAMSHSNEFSKEKFRKYFYTYLNNKAPLIDFSEAMALLDGDEVDRKLAVRLLQYSFSDRKETWERLFELYEKGALCLDMVFFIDSLARAFGHPDHFYHSGIHEFSDESRKSVRDRIKLWERKDMINALSIIDDNGLERGSIGQSVEIVLLEVDECEKKLLNIVLDEAIEIDIRTYAEVILAEKYCDYYLRNIEQIKEMGSEITEYCLDNMLE